MSVSEVKSSVIESRSATNIIAANMKTFSILVSLFLLIGSTLCLPQPHYARNPLGQEPVGPIEEWECQWDGVFPYDDACENYVECWDNVATLWTCTDLMLFDLTYLGCNYAQYTHCQNRPRPTNVPSTLVPTEPTTTLSPNATTVTTEKPSDDFDCPADGVFAHPERCEYYFNCYAGEPQLIHCPSDQLFDLVYMGCNHPELTHCQDRVRPPGAKPTLYPSTTARPTTPGTGTGPTSPPGDDFQCPEGANGDYADPKDCGKFYSCVGGVAFSNSCPSGLHFDPERDLCDYPSNVDCGERPIP